MTTVEYGNGLEQAVFSEVAHCNGHCGHRHGHGHGKTRYTSYCDSSALCKIDSAEDTNIPLRPTLPKITTNTPSLLETYVSTVGKEEVSLLTKLEELDLDPIKVKLMDAEEGYGWTREQADSAANAYKQFLFISAKYDGSSIVPTKLVDKVWHYHILDTRKYAEDSQKIFGRFLHHFPYFGMRGEEDAENLKAAFEETLDLFVENFGVSQIASFDQENTEAKGVQDVTAESSSGCGGNEGYCKSDGGCSSCEHY